MTYKYSLKHLVIIVGICAFIITGCCPNRVIKPEPGDDQMMHLIIERSRPDTAKKYLHYFFDKYKLPTTSRQIPDGVYRATSSVDDFGYAHSIELTIKNGEFYRVEYDETKDGHSKTADSAYCAEMEASVKGSAPRASYPYYEIQLMQKQDLYEMDAVSGATYSLYRMQFVVAKALCDGGD